MASNRFSRDLAPLRAAFVMAVLGAAVHSPAPINDARTPHKYMPEQSQAQLTKEQALTGKVAPVGREVDKEGRTLDLRENATGDGGDAVRAATAKLDEGNAVIKEATQRVESYKGRHWPAWLVAALLGALAFGVVRGFRTWADRAIPTPFK